MDNNWSQSSHVVGTGHNSGSMRQTTDKQAPAGINTAMAGYLQAANDYPRFERQLIRARYNPEVINGTVQPHPELLRRYPNREVSRPATGVSARSRQSGCSGRSGHSSRSATSAAGSAIAASVASSGPKPGYYHQVAAPSGMYTTSNSAIGAVGYVGREPNPGRQAWSLGRGGGQQVSADSTFA